MTVSTELLSSTLQKIKKTATDQLYQSTPILDLMKKMGGFDVGEHGIEVTEPIGMTAHSSPTAFPTGWERSNQTFEDVLQRYRCPAADIGQQIIITRKEREENKGPLAIAKVAGARLDAAFGSQRRTINRHLLAGDDPIGIAAGLFTLYGHNAGATGFLEGRTPATQANTVAGIPKNGVNAALPGTKNGFQNALAAFGTNGRRMMTSLQTYNRTRGQFGPANLIIASEDGFVNYRETLADRERYRPSDELNGGRESLMYGAAVIEPDLEMPTNATAAFIATMYFLNTKGVYLAFWSGNEFDLGPLEKMTGDQPGEMAWLYTKVQAVPKSLASCAFLGNGNTN